MMSSEEKDYVRLPFRNFEASPQEKIAPADFDSSNSSCSAFSSAAAAAWRSKAEQSKEILRESDYNNPGGGSCRQENVASTMWDSVYVAVV